MFMIKISNVLTPLNSFIKIKQRYSYKIDLLLFNKSPEAGGLQEGQEAGFLICSYCEYFVF